MIRPSHVQLFFSERWSRLVVLTEESYRRIVRETNSAVLAEVSE